MKKAVFRIMPLLLLFLLSCGSKGPDYWPTEEWRTSSPEAQGVDSRRLSEALEPLVESEAVNLHSVLIIRNGYIIAEYYGPGHGPETLHNQYSVTKSFVSTLIGMAVDQGQLNIDDPVLSFFPEKEFSNRNELKEEMTVEHLLTMSSGLDWPEHAMDFSMGNFWRDCFDSEDWVQAILDRKVITTPGFLFNYSSGNSHILSAILEKSVEQGTRDFAREQLFLPLGITDYLWMEDPTGIPTGGFGLYLRPRDMAKLGLLYLNEGQWDGQQLLSRKWIQSATTNAFPDGDTAYGYQFWLGDGFYYAKGSGEQLIYVFPDSNVIIVATAAVNYFLQAESNSVSNNFWNGFWESVVSKDPLPENPDALKGLEESLQQASEKKPEITEPPASIRVLQGRTISLDKNDLDVTSLTLMAIDDEHVEIKITAIDPEDGVEKSAVYTATLDSEYTENGYRGYPLSASFSFQNIKYYHPDPDQLPVFLRVSFPDEQSMVMDFMIPGSTFPSRITLVQTDTEPYLLWEGAMLAWNSIGTSRYRIQGRLSENEQNFHF